MEKNSKTCCKEIESVFGFKMFWFSINIPINDETNQTMLRVTGNLCSLSVKY